MRSAPEKLDLWNARLARFLSSPLSVTRFCQDEGITVSSFYYWAKRLGVDTSRQARRDVNASHTPPGSPLSAEAVDRQQLKSYSDTDSGSSSSLHTLTHDGGQASVRFAIGHDITVSVPATCNQAIHCVLSLLMARQHGTPQQDDASGQSFQQVVVRTG